MNVNKKPNKKIKATPFIIILLFLGFFFMNRLAESNNTIASDVNKDKILYDRVNYKDCSKENLIKSKESGRTLLFFAATTWCSNCVELEKQILTHMNDLPRDITILKVDYDNDREMKSRYGVTMQTTLILLDSNGKEIKRWIGTDFDDLLKNLN